MTWIIGAIATVGLIWSGAMALAIVARGFFGRQDIVDRLDRWAIKPGASVIIGLGALFILFALAGCATNGNGLIGPGGHDRGCFTIHDAGRPPRTTCTE